MRLPITGRGPAVMFHRLLERVAELRVHHRAEGTPAERAAWDELLDQLLAAPEMLVATCATSRAWVRRMPNRSPWPE